MLDHWYAVAKGRRALTKEKREVKVSGFPTWKNTFAKAKKVEVFHFVVSALWTVRQILNGSKNWERFENDWHGDLDNIIGCCSQNSEKSFLCKYVKEREEIWPDFTTCSWSEHYSIDSDYEYEINKRFYTNIWNPKINKTIIEHETLGTILKNLENSFEYFVYRITFDVWKQEENYENSSQSFTSVRYQLL